MKRQRLDLNYGIAFGRGDLLANTSEVFSWIRRKLAEGRRLLAVAEQIVNVALQEALGTPGTPGDPEKLVYVAQSLAETYRHAIEWAIESRRVGVGDDEFQEIVRIVGTFLNNMIKEIEEFSEKTLREIEEAIANLPGPNEEKKVLHFTLKITMFGMEDFNQELNRIREVHGLEPYDEDEES